jgi:hypothetical protein
MGSTHFLTRGLARVGTEMALHVLGYNFKRIINPARHGEDDESNATADR